MHEQVLHRNINYYKSPLYFNPNTYHRLFIDYLIFLAYNYTFNSWQKKTHFKNRIHYLFCLVSIISIMLNL